MPSYGDLVLFLLGILISYYLGRRQGSRMRTAPELRYRRQTSLVVSSQSEVADLEIKFRGSVIPRLVRTRFAMWLDGDTVLGSSIQRDDPLRIFAESGEIVDVRVIGTSRSQNGVTAHRESEDVAQIHFEFLDSGDGAVIDVLHTNNSSPTITGTVPGLRLKDLGASDLTTAALARRGATRNPKFWKTYILTPALRAAVPLSPVFLIIIVGAAISALTNSWERFQETLTTPGPYILCGVGYVLMFILMLLSQLTENHKAKVPKSLVKDTYPEKRVPQPPTRQ
jgi:hypothetical protein